MDKKFMISFALSIATVVALQYYWGTRNQEPKGVVSVEQQGASGSSVQIPSTETLYKPLQFDIDLAEEKIPAQENHIDIETDLVSARFSAFGGTLQRLDFKEHAGKNARPLRTIYEKSGFSIEERDRGCFMLALDGKTPLIYSLNNHTHNATGHTLLFQAETKEWIIKKTYTIHTDSYVIDLKLNFVPKNTNSSALAPRLFFTAPFLNELEDDSIKPFVLNESSKSIEIKELNDVRNLAWYWANQRVIFGSADRYFAHTLVKDESKFVQRGYYKKVDDSTVFSILEGPEIKDEKEWNLSFYLGPKVYDHLVATDPQLADLLSFGWLSWFCKIMLRLLDFVFDYAKNYGVAIILLSILLRLPFIPLSLWSRRKMDAYQRHQPFINHIRAKYKHDSRMQQQEIMRYHKDHNLSPATPVVGCLPLLIQLPILFSLYRVLGSYLDLYQAPFFGWIHDLSSRDPLYILPVLMGITMVWQQSLTPSTDEKQRVVMWFMAIFMTVVFSGFPAGLVLYWLMNNVLTISEDYLRKLLFRN